MTVPYLNTATGAMITIGMAMLAANFFSANMFAAVTDLFPMEQAGRATGLTGLAGGLSGLLFPLLTGWTVDHFSYRPVFLMVAFMPLLGVLGLFIFGRKYRTPELSLPAESVSA
jgi:ACS family hexuronate transporter-like MFS transporter